MAKQEKIEATKELTGGGRKDETRKNIYGKRTKEELKEKAGREMEEAGWKQWEREREKGRIT